ncbi:hypothetical protein [Nocardia sp. NPDC052316]|uniref:hypothetical protein n=1 Tax=Nocardia sp. NPDC052316 TaxID=3364329 RepID=UPI0037C667D0
MDPAAVFFKILCGKPDFGSGALHILCAPTTAERKDMAVDAMNVRMIGLRVSLLAALIVTGDLLLDNEIARDLALLAGQLTIELLLSGADTATSRLPGNNPDDAASDRAGGGSDD